MTIATPRSVLLGMVLAVLAMSAAVPSAGAVSGRPADELQLAAPAASPLIFGQVCPDVMVIGARGTNEGPTTDPKSPPAYVKDPDHGVGQTVDSMFKDLVSA